MMKQVKRNVSITTALQTSSQIKCKLFILSDTDNQRVIIHLTDTSEEQTHESPHKHTRQKRRVTRAVRPTKRIEFAESDGDTEGRNVFQLEKETERETFKIRDDNPWVTVETNGAVRVKKKWDYEELGPEKTIDFWVIISNQGHNGTINDVKLKIFIFNSKKGLKGFNLIIAFVTENLFSIIFSVSFSCYIADLISDAHLLQHQVE